MNKDEEDENNRHTVMYEIIVEDNDFDASNNEKEYPVSELIKKNGWNLFLFHFSNLFSLWFLIKLSFL